MKRGGKTHEQTKSVQKVQPAQPSVTTDDPRSQLRQKLCAEVEKITVLGARWRVFWWRNWRAVWLYRTGTIKTAASSVRVRSWQSIKPANIVEAQLVAQMVATYECAMRAMERAMDRQQPPEGIDMNIKRAARMMQLHLEQIEACRS